MTADDLLDAFVRALASEHPALGQGRWEMRHHLENGAVRNTSLKPDDVPATVTLGRRALGLIRAAA